MATRQYIGARYVPKFFDDGKGSSEWVSGLTYEPLTVVTHLGNSFTSKKPVPVGVDILDTKYWCVTGNYNEQVESYREEVEALNNSLTYYIREPENSDITEILNKSLKKGNVVLDGKNYIIKSLSIPNYRHLYGNNSILKASDEVDVCITIGENLHSGYDSKFSATGVSDLTINCDNKCNGVLIYGQGDIVNNVSVLSPKTYGFKIGTNIEQSSDININNCRVNGVCDYGFIVQGSDNYLTECRTLFCRTSFQNNGGGNYYTLCHGLGVTSDVDGYDSTSSFEINNNATLNNCYCDNSRYGVYAPNYNGNIVLDGIYCNWYEFTSTIERIGIVINGGSNVTIKNVICDNTNPNITRLKISNVLQWMPLSNFDINFDILPGTRYNSNDISFLAEFNRNTNNYMSGKVDGYNAICGYQNFYGDGQSNSACNFNIYADEFMLLGVSLRITGNSILDPKGFYTVNKGNFIADSLDSASIEIALLRKNNDLFIAYKILNNSITYNSNVIIEGCGANLLYLPRDGVNLDNATVITSFNLTK